MAYEIVKFEDDSGTEVSITPQDVRNTFCRNATDQEIVMFMALCANQHLNPWTKEAYLIKYGSGPAQIVTARSAFQKRADANPDYEGTETGVVVLCQDGSIQRLEGEAYYPMAGMQLIGGWARVYRKDRRPTYSEVSMAEYSTGKSNWSKMPGTMITKVAEVHALRMAFPTAFEGMYSPEEMDKTIEATVESDVAPADQQPAESTYEVSQRETVAQQPMQQPATQRAQGPTDAEKAELRRLTDECVKLNYDGNETAHYLFDIFRTDGMDAVRQAADRLMQIKQQPSMELAPDDIEW